MSTVTVEYAQSHLRELIENLKSGDELTIVSDGKPIARLLPAKKREPGSAKGLLTIVAEDDEHLRDFAIYMQ